MSRRDLCIVVLAVAAAAGALAGFAGAAPRSQAAGLRVDVAEWSVVPSLGVLRAGRVRITVRNLGLLPHSLMVVRTGSFDQELSVAGDRAVAVPVVSPVLVSPGAVKSFVVRLSAGSYLLLDNLPWHYWKGTSVGIAVR